MYILKMKILSQILTSHKSYQNLEPDVHYSTHINAHFWKLFSLLCCLYVC